MAVVLFVLPVSGVFAAGSHVYSSGADLYDYVRPAYQQYTNDLHDRHNTKVVPNREYIYHTHQGDHHFHYTGNDGNHSHDNLYNRYSAPIYNYESRQNQYGYQPNQYSENAMRYFNIKSYYSNNSGYNANYNNVYSSANRSYYQTNTPYGQRRPGRPYTSWR